MKQNAYKQAGVDIEAGNALVQKIKPFAASTNRSGNMGNLGGFGAFFDLKATGYQDPILVAATDGVGTKLKIAIETQTHQNIGQDLVAMCVNDLLVQGAEPLFFLDYYASGKLNVEKASIVIKSISEGCKLAGAALIGGETAEMPSLYKEGDYDLAGFAVGAVERAKMLTGALVAEGDIVLGLASSGLHSNGYSLVRAVIERAGLNFESQAPFNAQKNLKDILLEPTKIYVQSLLPLLKNTNSIKALAHITGGGLLENIPRVLPDNLSVVLHGNSWNIQEIFKWLKNAGQISATDMALTFNCGIGMVIIADEENCAEIMAQCENAGETVYKIGTVKNRNNNAVEILNWESAWI